MDEVSAWQEVLGWVAVLVAMGTWRLVMYLRRPGDQ